MPGPYILPLVTSEIKILNGGTHFKYLCQTLNFLNVMIIDLALVKDFVSNVPNGYFLRIDDAC